jgi:cytidine deaminase
MKTKKSAVGRSSALFDLKKSAPSTSDTVKVPKPVLRAFENAVACRARAYAPYSKFKVGSALLAKDGTIFYGCNVENASYGATICAERVALLKAVSEGYQSFTDIVVVTDASTPAFPCALCLQVMAEFFAPDARVWVADTKGIRSVNKFAKLLTKPFGPRQLSEARR